MSAQQDTIYDQIKTDLIEYVVNQKTTKEIRERIKTFCEQQTPRSMVLYRGHNKSTEIRHNNLWYSATASKKVAKHEFASENCCVFKINLIDVPVIDINYYVGDSIGKYNEEQEYIFLGGGTFYKNNKLDVEGFVNNGNGEYECWYKIDKIDKTSFDLDKTLGMLIPDEYDFIDSWSDIFIEGLTLTEDQKKLIFRKIQKIKKKGGNKKINKKTKKTNKKINKKTKKTNKKIKKKTKRQKKKTKKNKLIGV